MDPSPRGDSQAQLRTLDLFFNRCFVNRWQVRTDPLHDWSYTHPTPMARKHIPLRGTLSRIMPNPGLRCVTASHAVKMRAAKLVIFDSPHGRSMFAYRYERHLL